jgi:hypothetical protein
MQLCIGLLVEFQHLSRALFVPFVGSPKTEPGIKDEEEEEVTSGPPPTRYRWMMLSFVFPAHAVRGPPLQAAQVDVCLFVCVCVYVCLPMYVCVCGV